MSGFRTDAGGRIDRSKPVAFTFDGRALSGFAGDTLASALLANGVHLVGRSFKYHRPRGILSAGAEEPNALVTVDRGEGRETPNLRATQVELFDGLVARSQNRWPSLSFDVGAVNDALSPLLPPGFYYKTFMWPQAAWTRLYEPAIRASAGLGRAPRKPDPDRYLQRYAHCDVLVVGAGPAGLAAAVAAADAGARVILCDEQAEFGGSLLHETATVEGKAAATWVADAIARLGENGAVRLLNRTTAFGYFAQNFVGLVERVSDHLAAADEKLPRERLWQVRAREVVLATGAIERPLVFPGNDRPGVMLADAVRAYLRRYGVKAGSRAVIVTDNDTAYRTALDIHTAGIAVAAIADTRPAPDSEAVSAARAAGIPIMPASGVLRTRGRLRVASTEIAPIGRSRGDQVSCDLVLMSGGWTPSIHLYSQSRGKPVFDEAVGAFVPGVSVQRERSAGACKGTFDLAPCVAEGRAAGEAAAKAAMDQQARSPRPSGERALSLGEPEASLGEKGEGAQVSRDKYSPPPHPDRPEHGSARSDPGSGPGQALSPSGRGNGAEATAFPPSNPPLERGSKSQSDFGEGLPASPQLPLPETGVAPLARSRPSHKGRAGDGGGGPLHHASHGPAPIGSGPGSPPLRGGGSPSPSPLRGATPDQVRGRLSPASAGEDPGRLPLRGGGSSRGKAFVDFQNDVTAKDLKLAVREGFRSIEHVKRYTTSGMATDQGKTSNLNALAIVAEAEGRTIPAVGLTTFRMPYTPVTFGALAGTSRGDLFDPIRMTPIHPWAAESGAVFEDVGLWKRARYFPKDREDMHAAVMRECKAVRTAVGIFDATTLGKIEVVGPDAAEFMNRMYVNAWKKLDVGRCRYGLMLTEAGYVMDDGIVGRVAADRFHVTTTTGGAPRVLHHMEDYLQTEFADLKVWLTSTTEQWAVIAVQGRHARDVIAPLVEDIDIGRTAMPHMSLREGRVAGAPARLFRVSFTGELGYEINVPADRGREVWEAVYDSGRAFGITPYGTETMHVLRAEKGYIIVGQESDGTVIPDDLGLSGMIGQAKPDFVGKRSLMRPDMTRADRKQLVGLLTVDPKIMPEEGAQVVAGLADGPDGRSPLTANGEGSRGASLGHVTSSYMSAALGRPIALAMVASGRERHGQRLTVPMPGRPIAVEVVEPVFYDPEGTRVHG